MQEELNYEPTKKKLLPTLLTELTPEKYAELDLLSWVVKESMRITPAVPFSVDYKAVRRGCRIRGVEIPQEAALFLDISVVQKDARNW